MIILSRATEKLRYERRATAWEFEVMSNVLQMRAPEKRVNENFAI